VGVGHLRVCDEGGNERRCRIDQVVFPRGVIVAFAHEEPELALECRPLVSVERRVPANADPWCERQRGRSAERNRGNQYQDAGGDERGYA